MLIAFRPAPSAIGFSALPIWLGLSPRFVRSPVPSCPYWLLPQHFRSPPSSSAHAEPFADTDIALAFRPAPRSTASDWRGTRLSPRLSVCPRPISPEPLKPQHFTTPVEDSAQVVFPPSASAIASARQVALQPSPGLRSSSLSQSSPTSTFSSPQLGAWHAPALHRPAHVSPSLAVTRSGPHVNNRSPRQTTAPGATETHSVTVGLHDPSDESQK